MKAVAVKELMNRLTRYLREVATGETVLVIDRGRVVAELRRPSSGVRLSAFDRALEPLEAEGVLLLGLPQDAGAYRRSRVKIRHSTQEFLDAEREER